MRTVNDFDAYYRQPDPWGLRNETRRDRALETIITHHVDGKSLLELGCGEGHLTATIFRNAKSIRGIDISPTAVSRATARSIPNATFEASDFLNVSFSGYDVIAAVECLYYLSPAEQDVFFKKLVREHAGNVFILSAPIIGANEHRTYYTHSDVLRMFSLYGISVVAWRNLNAYGRAGVGAKIAAAATTRLPPSLSNMLLPYLREKWVYQRCYVSRCPK